MQIKFVKLNEKAILPTNIAHENDAGIDFITPRSFKIFPGHSITIKTGMGWEVLNPKQDKKYMIKLESKSGLMTRYKVNCCGGVIDEGYRGDISVMLHNFGDDVIDFARGDKIVQGIIVELPITTICYGTEFTNIKTSRGENGFGSSGR